MINIRKIISYLALVVLLQFVAATGCSASSEASQLYSKPTQKVRMLQDVDVYNLAEIVYTLKKGEMVTPLFVHGFVSNNKVVVEDKAGNRAEVLMNCVDIGKLTSPLLY